jgi:hypothetical protein
MQIFCVRYAHAGAVVFFFSLMLLIASRRLERAILAKHGLRSHLQYAKYIQDDDLNAHTQEHHMDANMLKVPSACTLCLAFFFHRGWES